MVEPDRVVQDELLVPLPPVVSDLVVAVDDQGWDTEHLEPCVGSQARLTGTYTCESAYTAGGEG